MQSKKRRSVELQAEEEKPQGSGKNLRIFVRRGAIRRFARLTRDSRLLPVDIDWDRRQEERRAAAKAPAPDRRQADRRRKPPFTWDMADFVVTESKRKDDK